MSSTFDPVPSEAAVRAVSVEVVEAPQGDATVLGILDAMHAFYRDPRYRPSPWLIRRARLGVSLLTPEN